MEIVLFAHPDFLGHQSMPRFANMLAKGLRAQDHQVEIVSPSPRLSRLAGGAAMRKWLGYFDQYFLFPEEFRGKLKCYSASTLFVFADHALGPWVPLVANRPHVIHCHDFLAQSSARGDVPENPLSWTGRQYQSFIRRGYSCGKHFISVSEKTRNDLHHFLPSLPITSEVVYNGFNQHVPAFSVAEARARLASKLPHDVSKGYLLHVGGNQWYKDRPGVVALYTAWRHTGAASLPLLLVGAPPDEHLESAVSQSPFQSSIHLLSGLTDQEVQLAYAGATALLYPSLAEGFGWPIAEAMAAGCPVITTQEAPMTEVGANAAFYLPRRPPGPPALAWLAAGVHLIQQVVELSTIERERVVRAGLINASRFASETALASIESIYKRVLLMDTNP